MLHTRQNYACLQDHQQQVNLNIHWCFILVLVVSFPVGFSLCFHHHFIFLFFQVTERALFRRSLTTIFVSINNQNTGLKGGESKRLHFLKLLKHSSILSDGRLHQVKNQAIIEHPGSVWQRNAINDQRSRFHVVQNRAHSIKCGCNSAAVYQLQSPFYTKVRLSASKYTCRWGRLCRPSQPNDYRRPSIQTLTTWVQLRNRR